MRIERRDFLRLGATAAVLGAGRRLLPVRALAAGGCEPAAPFDPKAWLAARGQTKLTTVTPQSGLPLIPIRAQKLTKWESERQGYLAALRELLGPWPERPSLDPAVHETVDNPADPFVRHKVSYRSLACDEPHAERIKAWLLVPRGGGPRPAIVTLHQTVLQGKDEPAGVNATLPWLAHADYYARRGYVTLAPDAIGYGERTKGCNAAQGFELADAWPILKTRPEMTLAGLMTYDVSRALDYLQTRPEVDPARIGLMGHSQGGFLTNFTLPLERRFAVGVASCGYGIFRTDAFFERWAAPNSAYIPWMWKYRVKRNDLPVDFLQILALAAPIPQMLQTAQLDTVWSPSAVAPHKLVWREVARIHAMYGSPFVNVVADGDHGWYPQGQAAADALFARVFGS
jgi:dienelactone hydrolase